MVKSIQKSANISSYLNKNQTTYENDRLPQNIQKLIEIKRRIRTGNNTDIPVLNNNLIKRKMYLKIK
jgi:hypothetical protein